MVLDADWAVVSAWAAMITAIGAIVAVWLQNSHARITRSLDLLLRLEDKFDSDRMKDLRRKAAAGLLDGKFVDEAYYVLDFFEEAGLLLRMKAIHEKVLFESFFHSPPAYWFTARKHILALRQKKKELYDNLEYLSERFLVYSRKKTGESSSKLEDEAYWKDFIVRETHAA